MLQCPPLSAVVVPMMLPLLDSVTLSLASAVPAMLIEEALFCAGATAVITGTTRVLGTGGAGGGAGGTKSESGAGGVGGVGAESKAVAVAPFALRAAPLDFVTCSDVEDCEDELLFGSEKLIGRAFPGKISKLGFVVEPFCPLVVGPCIACRPTENV